MKLAAVPLPLAAPEPRTNNLIVRNRKFVYQIQEGDMNALLRRLHRDHNECSQSLDLLEQQLNLFRQGEPADLNVLSETVEYLQTHPDGSHHACEDIILSVYLERTERGVKLFDRLGFEHSLLLEQSEALLDQLGQWARDLPVPRGRIATLLGDYLKTQRGHLHLEEHSIRSLVASHLTVDDWERIGAIAAPVLGSRSGRHHGNHLGRAAFPSH